MRDSRHRSPLGALLAAVAAVALVAAVGSSAAFARGRPPIRSCGELVTRVPNTGSHKYLYVDRVDARRISCGHARAFFRGWERLGDENKLPQRATGRIHRSVLVWNKWGRPYRAGGFVCRSMALPGALLEPARVTCGSPAGLVTWHETRHSG
jgi:hypothetical protein